MFYKLKNLILIFLIVNLESDKYTKTIFKLRNKIL